LSTAGIARALNSGSVSFFFAYLLNIGSLDVLFRSILEQPALARGGVIRELPSDER
jgi:hypothetical protein